MTPPDQLTRADLAGMTSEAIEEARTAGRLDRLLGIPAEETRAIARARNGEPLDLADVRTLARRGHHDLIADASRGGRITKETPA